jgi:tRNA (guanine26-N2/guanine27-N2)-dimethyltransferase
MGTSGLDQGREGKFPFPTQIVTEGSVELTVPRLSLYAKGPSEYVPSKAPVFYNPLMEMNRHIAVLALRVYQRRVGRSLQVCDPLSGCGVRGLRFALEVDDVDRVVLNDLNPQAVKLARFNVEANGLSDLVVVENLDANALLSRSASPSKRFDAVDVDPYGSPSPFLDSAVRALRNGGLIALTATDMAVLCGGKGVACVRKYFGKPLKVEYCHELAIRLLINALVFSAARHELGVSVLLSHQTGHCIRVYAKIEHGATEANDSVKKIGYILHCFKCLNRRWLFGFPDLIEGTCDICGGKMGLAGPLWLGRLVDGGFCAEMIDEASGVDLGIRKRVSRLLSMVLGEADAQPTYYVVNRVCKKLGLRVPSKKSVIRRLGELGYKATSTHFKPMGIKSNAPIGVVESVIKESL